MDTTNTSSDWTQGLDPQEAADILDEHQAATAALVDEDDQPQLMNVSIGADNNGVTGTDAGDTSNNSALPADVIAAMEATHLQDSNNETHDQYAAAPLDSKYWSLAEEPIGDRMAFQDTFFGQIPFEVRELVFNHLFGTDNVVDLTIPHAKRGQPRLVFQSWFPFLRTAFGTVLLACKDLREEGFQHLSKETRFINRYSDSAKHLPRVFRAACSMIQRFDLMMDFRTKTMHEWQFAPLIKLLIEDMPNLTRFRLISDYQAQSIVFPPNESDDPHGTVSRHQQELRAIIRLCAFLIPRHPRLKVMVLPAQSGPTHHPNEQRIVTLVELYASDIKREFRTFKRFADGDALVKTEFKDLVLNSTLIRTFLWTELAIKDPLDMAINAVVKNEKAKTGTAAPKLIRLISKPREVVNGNEIKTSEVPPGPTDTNFFEQVDARGYLTPKQLMHRGFQGRWEVYDLIRDARKTRDKVLEAVSTDMANITIKTALVKDPVVIKNVADHEELERVNAAKKVEAEWKQKWANRTERRRGNGGRGRSRGRRGGGTDHGSGRAGDGYQNTQVGQNGAPAFFRGGRGGGRGGSSGRGGQGGGFWGGHQATPW